MTPGSGDSDIGPLITDLVRTLRRLEAEFEPRTKRGLPRPPSPRELMQFTSDVTIPAAILILRTNIEALKLLRKAIRLSEGRPTTESPDVRRTAQQLSETTLARLDGALADLQDAIEGTPRDEEASALLDEARSLRADVETRLDMTTNGESPKHVPSSDDDGHESVPVDVDAELRSIKDEFDSDDVVDGEDGGDDGGEESE